MMVRHRQAALRLGPMPGGCFAQERLTVSFGQLVPGGHDYPESREAMSMSWPGSEVPNAFSTSGSAWTPCSTVTVCDSYHLSLNLRDMIVMLRCH